MPYAEVDGVRLHLREQGAGDVALLVHGFPLDSSMWIQQLDGLADLRRCIAVDLRGFGLSAPVTGEPLTMDAHAADLAAILDLVSAEEADIIGLSMGGYVALAFAELYSDRLRSLALVDTKAAADTVQARAGRDAMAVKLLAEGRGTLAARLESALLGPQASLSARARLRTMIERCPYETIVGALGGMRDRPDRSLVLDTVQVPAAVIVGEHDTVTPPAAAEEMNTRLPDSVLTLIPESGHMTPIEQPGAVSAALRELLERA